MTQVYSDPSRESDPHALPDVEVFYFDGVYPMIMLDDIDDVGIAGYYYQFCFPGCLPDSDPVGPFATAAEATAAAQEGCNDFPDNEVSE